MNASQFELFEYFLPTTIVFLVCNPWMVWDIECAKLVDSKWNSACLSYSNLVHLGLATNVSGRNAATFVHNPEAEYLKILQSQKFEMKVYFWATWKHLPKELPQLLQQVCLQICRNIRDLFVLPVL